jgi:hypothetical protein
MRNHHHLLRKKKVKNKHQTTKLKSRTNQSKSSRSNRLKSLVATPFFPKKPGTGTELGGGEATNADPA